MAPQNTDHLTPDELAAIRDRNMPPAAALPLAIVPSTGLSPPEYLHLHQEWIEFEGDAKNAPDQPLIRIPKSELCRRQEQTPGNTSPLDGFRERDEPCVACQSRSEEHRFKRRRPPETASVIVIDDHAAEMLEWWFSRNETIPWHARQFALKRVSREAIGREITLLSLQNTFIAQAASMGIDKPTIEAQLGVTQLNDKADQIVHDHDGGRSRSYTTFNQYLEFFEENGPEEANTLADHFDVAPGTARRRLQKFASADLVEKVKEHKTGTDGHKALWNSTEAPPITIQCSNDNCSEEFYAFNARSKHNTQNHSDE